MRGTDQRGFTELVAVARQYCSVIDQVPVRKDWLVPLCRLLPQLHAAVETLDESDAGALQENASDLDDRFDLYGLLHTQLGDRDLYWLEFDHPDSPHSDAEHRSGSLADDLTDIYFELRHGLTILNTAGEDEVAHYWEAGFHQHWGQHLVDAGRQLYKLRVNRELV